MEKQVKSAVALHVAKVDKLSWTVELKSWSCDLNISIISSLFEVGIACYIGMLFVTRTNDGFLIKDVTENFALYSLERIITDKKACIKAKLTAKVRLDLFSKASKETLMWGLDYDMRNFHSKS